MSSRNEMSACQLRPVMPADAADIARIYNHYVLNTTVTFEEAVVSAEEMAGRMDELAAESLPWLVAEAAGAIIGYAYAGKWKGRCAYRYSAESTVYLDHQHTGRGAGTLLYTQLLNMLRDRKLHAVMGGIALPNDASIALHEKLGFTKVAHFPEVGFKFDGWIDVAYWQKRL
jgi:phosphinothricin acetyltransferase